MLKMMQTVVAVVVFSLCSHALADNQGAHTTNMHAARKFGLGLGGASYGGGISAKYFLNEGLAVQGFLGSAFGASINLGADVLYVGPKLWSNQDFSLNWEVGGGAGTLFWTSPLYSGMAFSVSGVGGLSLQYRGIPLEFTTEIRPILSFGAGIGGLGIGGGGAIRYYF